MLNNQNTQSMVSASIVLHHTPKYEILRLLNCILESPIDVIFLVDNSSDDSLRELANISNKIVYIYSLNLGYGAGHNIAIRKSLELNAKYHIILNPDIYFEKDAIEILRKYMDQDQNVGAIMPKIEYPTGEVQYLCKLLPTPIDLIGRRFLPPRLIKRRNHKYELRRFGYSKIMNTPCLSGCFAFIRANIFSDIGFFDESFFMYCEDFDLYRRIHRKYKTIFLPDTTVIHDHKKESYKNKKMLLLHIKSAIHYFNKWGWFFDKERREVNQKVLKEVEDK